MKFLLILLPLFLTGCFGTLVETRIVEKPVPVKCIKQEDLPNKPIEYTKQVAPSAPLLNKINALIAENDERKTYEKQIEAVVIECIK